jgi:hypothetical protein
MSHVALSAFMGCVLVVKSDGGRHMGLNQLQGFLYHVLHTALRNHCVAHTALTVAMKRSFLPRISSALLAMYG